MQARFLNTGILAIMILSGCVASMERERPFTRDWAGQQESERAFKERKARIRGEEGLVLLGNPNKRRATVYMDEDSGRPRLDIGRKTGWGLDLRYYGGPAAKIKYKLKWNHAKPRMKSLR